MIKYKRDNDVKYLVIIDDSRFNEEEMIIYKTTCKTRFCGYLINSNCNQTIFELNNPSRSLVIVPTDRIKWMMPYEKV